MSTDLLMLAAVLPAGLALIAVTARWPRIGCGALVVLVPLTAGLAPLGSIPLRPDQAIVMCVFVGYVIHELERRNPQPYTTLDVIITAFCTGTVLIPLATLVVGRSSIASTTLRTILEPSQYLLVYLIFSRTAQDRRSLTWLLNLLMIASVVVGGIEMAQAVNLPGVTALVTRFYQAPPAIEGVAYRPGSLLIYYSAVGGFALLGYSLALALAASRSESFPGWWLALVMGVNVIALVASQTYATVLALPIMTVAICVYNRHWPRELLIVWAFLGIGIVALFPTVENRIQQEFGKHVAGSVSGLPSSLSTRIVYWRIYFLPALLRNGPWLGTGAVIPATVPSSYQTFVDNEYLDSAFRAGIPGVALLLAVFISIPRAALRLRNRADPVARAVGSVVAMFCVTIAVLDLTSEYLTLAGLSQEFWMLVGLAALFLTHRPERTPLIIRPRAGVRAEQQPAPSSSGSLARRFVASSTLVFVGLGIARLLGFGFSVVAARVLVPAAFGQLTYALGIATMASVLLTTAPIGLSGFLSRHTGDPEAQQRYYSSGLVVVACVLGLSLLASFAIAPLAGLRGWLIVGVSCNLLGVTALETYREVQRGFDRYLLATVFFVGGNLLQLVLVILASELHVATPALLVIEYGLANVFVLILILLARPITVRWSVRAVTREAIREVRRVVQPMMAQSVAYSVWFGSDVVLLQHYHGYTEAGHYGAAKTLAGAVYLAPQALSFVLVPLAARLRRGALASTMWWSLLLTCAVSLPSVGLILLLAHPLLALIYGRPYAVSTGALRVLAIGMGVYGLYAVLTSLWVGLGRTRVNFVSALAAMVSTVAAGVLLVPRAGLVGAAEAFSLGSIAQLAVVFGFSIVALRRETPATLDRKLDPAALSIDALARRLRFRSDPAPERWAHIAVLASVIHMSNNPDGPVHRRRGHDARDDRGDLATADETAVAVRVPSAPPAAPPCPSARQGTASSDSRPAGA